MLIPKRESADQFGRTIYEVDAENVRVKHFAVRTVTKEHPFKAHEHEQEELWFIIDGEGTVIEDDKEFKVKRGDLIHLVSWVKHGIETDGEVEFICLG